MAMKATKGETVEAQTIRLANRSFDNCIIQGCELIFDGSGPVHMNDTTIRNCTFHLEGPAVQTLAFLGAMSDILPDIVEGWAKDLTGKRLRFIP
jgi:hypothetical protein